MNFKIADSKFKELLLPTLLMVMALNISSVVDSFFVGSFIGPNAVAAIDLLEPMILLVTVFEWLFGLGGQILALNKKAEFDIDGSNGEALKERERTFYMKVSDSSLPKVPGSSVNGWYGYTYTGDREDLLEKISQGPDVVLKYK